MPHRITNESARQMYGLDLMLKEYLSRKTLLFKWLGYLAFWKTKIYWNFKETMLSYIWQKKNFRLRKCTSCHLFIPKASSSKFMVWQKSLFCVFSRVGSLAASLPTRKKSVFCRWIIKALHLAKNTFQAKKVHFMPPFHTQSKFI